MVVAVPSPVTGCAWFKDVILRSSKMALDAMSFLEKSVSSHQEAKNLIHRSLKVNL